MQHRHHHAMLILILIPMLIINTATANANETTSEIAIGVILDMESSVGKVSKICIEMAIRDFYQTHNNYTTRIVAHFRDSKNDRVEAVSAAIQLIKDVKVSAIIGPQTSSETDFVVDIGNKTRVPILSLATTPSLSPKENPYFIRISCTSSSQAQPISALINTFPWREVVLVYQDGDFGTGFIPSLSEALLNVNVQIKHPIVISPFASDHDISNELHNIKTRQTQVFVVHLLPELASRFFKKAKQAGMMQEGYAWIITDVVTNLLHTVDTDSMQGVVGVKPHIPKSDHLKRFKESFKNHSGQVINVYGLWSYDATYALAMALERVGSATTFHIQQQKPPVTDLDAIGTSKLGPTLLSEMRKIKLKGLTGDFDFVDRSYSGYEIVNIVGQEDKFIYLWKNEKATKISNENAIRWPGGSNESPRGWEIPGRKLKVGYPEIGGFREFIHKDDDTNETEPKGFCVDVFKAVMKNLSLPSPPSYEYMPFTIRKNETSGSYDTLVEQIHLKNFDVVIGDVTIRAERSSYVDFTLPYTESGVSMIVPIKKDDRKNAWVFMRPLETQLWFTTCAFFIYTGVVVWVLEHRVNKEFRGRPYKQVGMIFWFSFSTLVFAHKEKMISNLSRFVVIVWVFVVLVLQSSYIASLTSILTVEQLQPDFTDIHDLIRQGNKVGYKEGSFVAQMLKDMGFQDAKLVGYDSLQDYDNALSNKSVSAIFDELPYLNLFLAGHCNKYIMVGPTYKSAGFGFAFPKGSPLLPLVSKALLQVTENELNNITDKWLGPKADCSEQDMVSRSDMLLSDGSIRQKLSAIATIFNLEKLEESKQAPTDDNNNNNNNNNNNVLVIEDNIIIPPPTPEHHQASSDDDESEATPAHNVVEESGH
ncbi:putative periplasmic binding protein-like I [Helianthus debilis subsp. tardiflorus]